MVSLPLLKSILITTFFQKKFGGQEIIAYICS